MKPFVRILSIATIALSISACETVEGFKRDLSDISFDKFTTANSVNEDPQAQFLTDGNCPRVQIVNELSRLHEFEPGQTMQSHNLISSAEMNDAQSTCTFSERSVTVDLKLEIDGQLGPRGQNASNQKTFFSYPFFVAVTDANGKILAKEIFAASVSYEPGENEKVYYESLRQIIPADTRAQGASYKVMIGFQLAQKQLEYNRTLIAAEKIAAEKLELQRMEAERLKALEEKSEAQEMATATQKPVVMQKTTPASEPVASEPTPIVAPEPTRAGPFDIFKTDDQ